MIEGFTRSVDDTRALAAGVAALVQPGDLILLVGDLGAGKTAFTQGFGAALGVTDLITSPTFTLHRHYDGSDLTLHHLDVYRIDQLDEVVDLALPELGDGDTVTVIEWGDTIAPALPSDFLEIRLEFGAGADDRRISLRLVGARWSARRRTLAEALPGFQPAPEDGTC